MSSGRMGDDALWLLRQHVGFCQGVRLNPSAALFSCFTAMLLIPSIFLDFS